MLLRDERGRPRGGGKNDARRSEEERKRIEKSRKREDEKIGRIEEEKGKEREQWRRGGGRNRRGGGTPELECYGMTVNVGFFEVEVGSDSRCVIC